MNTRLKELMLEAGYAAPELAGRANKLAELIVKECANTASDFIYDWDGDRGIKRVILKEFGVEE